MAIPHASYENKSTFHEEKYNTIKGAAYAPSYSCCAFARYIYREHNGKETGTDCSKSTIDKIPMGSILKCTYLAADKTTRLTHWMIVGTHYKNATNGDGFTIYDANWVVKPRTESPYEVRVAPTSYKAFNDRFTIAMAMKP